MDTGVFSFPVNLQSFEADPFEGFAVSAGMVASIVIPIRHLGERSHTRAAISSRSGKPSRKGKRKSNPKRKHLCNLIYALS